MYVIPMFLMQLGKQRQGNFQEISGVQRLTLKVITIGLGHTHAYSDEFCTDHTKFSFLSKSTVLRWLRQIIGTKQGLYCLERGQREEGNI